MLTEAQAKQLLQRVLGLADKTKGQSVASLSSANAGNTRFAVSEITSSADVERQQLSVTIQFGKRSASATTNQLDERSVADVVARAARMAKLAPENPEAMPPLGKQTYRPARGAVDPLTSKLGPGLRAKAAGVAIAAADAAKTSIAGFFEHGTRMSALATSSGLWAHHAWTGAEYTCTARTPDGTGSGWAGARSHRAGELDAGALAKVAVDKAVASARPTRLDPGRYTVVLEPAAVASMLTFLTGALSARRADEGRSFFAKPGGGTRVGEKLFPELITLRDDATDPRLTTMPFDREGLPLPPTAWIENGVLKALLYGRYWGHKQSKPPTGVPEGWMLDGGTSSREELIKGIKRGVLITRMWYLRSLDPQTILATGLTRDGVFLIENGAITRPVNNFRFNESPIQMLAKADALGVPVVTSQGNMRVPAIRTHEFNLASISEAI